MSGPTTRSQSAGCFSAAVARPLAPGEQGPQRVGSSQGPGPRVTCPCSASAARGAPSFQATRRMACGPGRTWAWAARGRGHESRAEPPRWPWQLWEGLGEALPTALASSGHGRLTRLGTLPRGFGVAAALRGAGLPRLRLRRGSCPLSVPGPASGRAPAQRRAGRPCEAPGHQRRKSLFPEAWQPSRPPRPAPDSEAQGPNGRDVWVGPSLLVPMVPEGPGRLWAPPQLPGSGPSSPCSRLPSPQGQCVQRAAQGARGPSLPSLPTPLPPPSSPLDPVFLLHLFLSFSPHPFPCPIPGAHSLRKICIF